MRYLSVLLMCILAGAEVDLFVPSFPQLQKVFELSPFSVELMLGVNFSAYCLSSIVVGNLGDRLGRRPVILWGLVLFIMGSAFCTFATAYWHLLFGRFLQGVGIAGPAVLAYVVIADQYPVHQQQKLMGILNGCVTLAMAFAPVIGSYVNLYYGWVGNFVGLLSLGLISLSLCFFTLPKDSGNKNVNLSLASYLPVFKSKLAMTYIIAICFLVVPYWLFIGLSPILYMDSYGVPIDSFGFYQGALAAVFAITSLSSGRLIAKLGTKGMYYAGLSLLSVGVFIIALIVVFNINDPFWITFTLLIWSSGIVFPINILYPMSLESVPDAKGRIAAVIQAGRLLLTSASLQVVSYFYMGTFFSIGLAMCLIFMVAFFALFYLTHHFQVLKKH